MALSRRFPVAFDVAFPLGAYLVSEVSPVLDFDKSTKENKVQQVDPDTGMLLWSVDVLDADPEAKRASKTVSIKIPATVQPVPPAGDGHSPFTPIVFEGLTALPWIEESGNFTKISWSFRAQGLAAPAKQSTRSSIAGSSPSASSSSAAA